METTRNSLTPDTELDGYIITRLIGRGGFSLIYLASDKVTGETVVIKEYLPKKFAYRNPENQVSVVAETQRENLKQGRMMFYQEAKVLATLKHPNIVKVRNFFLANSTAYLVMDYSPGRNLGSYIKKRKGRMSATFINAVFLPILRALDMIHGQALLHLDIKPANIHLRPGGNPLLLDFGAVHQFATSRQGKVAQIVTSGFSPPEQYRYDGYVGPWSDLYAIGASMRACIEGKAPQPATERSINDKMKPSAKAFRRRYPAVLLEAMDWAMEIDPTVRPQSVREFYRAISVDGLIENAAEAFQDIDINLDYEDYSAEDS